MNKSTGSGGDIHSFCSGFDDEWPDVTAASRSMTEAERQRCHQNGVEGVTQLSIGYDGIVFASSISTPQVNFTRHQLYSALAKEVPRDESLVPNPHFSWNGIDHSLPSKKIEVMGPPGTSGTRDLFEQLAIKPGCTSEVYISTLGSKKQEEACTTLRQDGRYREMGENDLEVVKRLKIFENAFGIFGFSYILRYNDIVHANSIEGVFPTEETIASGHYPLSRPLYLYVKDRRVSSTPGLAVFLKEFLSDNAIGEEGYLLDVGLVPLDQQRKNVTQSVLMKLFKP